MTTSNAISPAARLWAWLLAGAIFLSVVVASLMNGRLGQPGPDGDDVMRLVQIRDLLAGQGWFDLYQYSSRPGWRHADALVPDTGSADCCPDRFV